MHVYLLVNSHSLCTYINVLFLFLADPNATSPLNVVSKYMHTAYIHICDECMYVCMHMCICVCVSALQLGQVHFLLVTCVNWIEQKPI